ncbi:MAG: DNA alkylation repair protein [Lewinellaceae bacterium]|nr:hypothetical protein [Phaeodactylibacter sp.]MCB9346774.1 DNA alkylation repair protein [Lewinellaceae bacterium]
MSTLLKDRYNPAFYDQFCHALASVLRGFDATSFQALIFDEQWEARELKDRMKHTSTILHHFLPQPFEKAAGAILDIVQALEAGGITENALEYMFFPDYIERFGLEHYAVSVRTMEELTPFTSCEFAVRPFIKKYEGKMLEQMLGWSEHANHHVRRLASEGSRPRLPWAMALPELKKDPSPVLPILENLKADSSEYVRRSVANSLNDISKDNPDIALSVFRDWIGRTLETDRLVKHGCRTLLKQGLPEVMELFGYSSSRDVELKNVQIHTPIVSIGGQLEFSFQLLNQGQHPALIRLEYGLYYLRANSAHSRKVFKISERAYPPGSATLIKRKQSFRPITTRWYYPGPHELSLIVNGVEVVKKIFKLRG